MSLLLILKDLRFHVSMTVFMLTVVLITTYVMRSHDSQSTSLIILIFTAGATGGIINSYIRLRDVPLENQKKLESTSNFLAIMQIYVSPMVSGLFAFIFYVLCVSGLIAGELFPNFSGLQESFVDVADIFDNVKPSARLDAIKSIMWGFITGFFEKFVPNILDKIIKDFENDDKNEKVKNLKDNTKC